MLPDEPRTVFDLHSNDCILLRSSISIFSLGMPSFSTMYLYLSSSIVDFPDPVGPLSMILDLSPGASMALSACLLNVMAYPSNFILVILYL